MQVLDEKVIFKGQEFDLLNFEEEAFFQFDGEMTQEEIGMYEEICSNIDIECIES